MLKKSLEQIVSDDPETERTGAYAAMEHALDMAGRGHFTAAEMRDLQRLFAQTFRDTQDGSEYDAMRKDGRFDQLQDLCGYADGEDVDEADARCQRLGVQVVAHFFASAAQAGLVSPQRALEEIAKYVALPAGDDAAGVVGAVLAALNAGRRLPLAGERQTSDAEVDQGLAKMRDRHGRPLMRQREDAGPSEAETEAYLDQATDRRGRPMFPREVAEEADGEPVTRTFRGPKAPAEAMRFMLRQLSRRRE
jgi:hypothetical protein